MSFKDFKPIPEKEPVKCNNCNYEGKIECDNCNGRGSEYCDRCGHDSECAECEGTGELDCKNENCEEGYLKE